MLEHGRVYLWSASLAGEAGPLGALLSPDECARRDRYVFPHLRERFAIGRALLRLVLGQCLGVAPEALEFTYGAHEKPAIAGHPLHFNLSHSEDRWLLAVCRSHAVGVDIEATRSVDDFEALAMRFFAPGERQALAALPVRDRHAAFFRGWTRKEAIMKLTGQGMSLPLDAFEVSLAADDARLIVLAGDAGAPGRIALADVAAPPGFMAAVAVDGMPCRLQPVVTLR